MWGRGGGVTVDGGLVMSGALPRAHRGSSLGSWSGVGGLHRPEAPKQWGQCGGVRFPS